VRKRIGDLEPGELFISDKGLYGSTFICMKLQDQKVVNLDTKALWRSVNQNETVEVLEEKLSIISK
jgi:hypothetical protein